MITKITPLEKAIVKTFLNVDFARELLKKRTTERLIERANLAREEGDDLFFGLCKDELESRGINI